MNITTLTIYVNDNEIAAPPVSEDQSPALFKAFKAWQDAEQASHDEAAKWDRVLEVAAEYLSDAGNYLHADGDVEVSDVTWFAKEEPASVRCDQCAACMIQGVFCHETGCANTHSRFDAESGEWVKQRKCFECGCTVDATDPCCNAQDPEFHLADAECGLDEHEDTDSLEDRGITLGSYAS